LALRTAVFHTPQLIHTLLMLAATRGLLAPSVGYTANAAPSGWHWNLPPYALVSLLLTVLLWLLTILLFSTARRGNGWTGVHELLSRTVSCSGTSGPLHPPLRRRHLPISFRPFVLCDASDRTPCIRRR
jgi:hypothetical protein